MKQRTSAEQTRINIIKAARTCFLDHGYSAASMKTIAKTANVTKSLLFYHFTNKEMLWNLVKQDILKDAPSPTKINPEKNAEHVIREIVDLRFSLYQQCPDVVRLMQWQQLAIEKKELAELNQSPYSPYQWREPLKKLQSMGQIRQDMSIENIILLLASTTIAPFTMNYFVEISENANLSQLRDQLRDCLLKALLV